MKTPEQLGIPREWNVGARAQQSRDILQVECSVSHEDYFTGQGAYSIDKTDSDELWTCPGCGAAL